MNSINHYTARPITKICTTTLAQDAFNLYHTVIEDVTERIQRDLKDLGKNESEVKFISKLLKSTWKRALDESHCIDHENLIGINLNDIARNIGQEHKSKRQKLNDSEQFATPRLISTNNLLPLENKTPRTPRTPNMLEMSNPYIRVEDLREPTPLSLSFSCPATPLKKEYFPWVVNAETTVLEGGGTVVGTALRDNNMSPRKYKRTLEKPLGSDDDDTEDDGEEPTDLVVCAYSRVMKKRGDWNIDLKNGLIHFAGKDYAFKAARGGHLVW